MKNVEKKRCGSCFREYEDALCPYCGGAQNEEHQLPVGTVIRDRYQIGKVLGQGGFGITYIAWDILMRKCVAVKEFYPTGTVFRKSELSTAVECGTKAMIPHYEYSRERFLREASALVQFQEIPEVVGIQDFVKENNTAYIVMEYVRGVDLAKYIQRKGGRLSVDETFRILRPVMEALAKVHKGGIVHRDISPDNIILDPMGGAKLLDFGAVRAVEDPDVEKGLSKSTEAILKQGFAPIEQYNTRGSLGPWTDEYAMCATVFYCLTGRIPEEASIRMSEGIDPDWSSIPGLPEHQRKALEKGISCRAKDRYPDMDQLLEALFPEEMAQTVPEPVEEASVTQVKKKTKAPQRNGKKFWTVFTAAVLALWVVLAVFLPKEKPTEAGETVPQETVPVQIQTQPTEPIETEPPTVPMSPEEEAYLQAEALLAEGKLGEAAIAFGKLAGYADARERSFEIWDKIAVRDTISAGLSHTVGLKTDGTAITAGSNLYGACDVGAWSDIVAVSGGFYYTVGLKADGTVVAVGNNDCGQCNVEGWTDIVAVSAGFSHTVGLRADGSVVAVGANSTDDRYKGGPCDVKEWTDIVVVSAGSDHTVGLRADGTVVAVGYNEYSQCDLSGWTDIVAIAAGSYHTVGLRADGTVIAVGDNYYGQCDVSGWTNIVAISVDSYHTMGLKADGTVVAVGRNDEGQCDVKEWTNIIAISTGRWHTVGLQADGTVVAVGSNSDGQCGMALWTPWTDILVPENPVPFR